MSYALALSPGGHLFVEPDDQAEPKLSPNAGTRLTEAFAASGARGLELLAAGFLHESLPPTFSFWRGWGASWTATRARKSPGRRVAGRRI